MSPSITQSHDIWRIPLTHDTRRWVSYLMVTYEWADIDTEQMVLSDFLELSTRDLICYVDMTRGDHLLLPVFGQGRRRLLRVLNAPSVRRPL